MSTKAKIGLAVVAAAVSLLFDVVALKNSWPTPGGYMILRIFHPWAGHDWQTDVGPFWFVRPVAYAALYGGTNFFCCLAIFYAIYRIFRKFQQDSRDSAT